MSNLGPRPLEFVDTDDLIDELKIRSRVFFLAMRTLAEKDQDTIYSFGVNGNKDTNNDEERDSCIGLAERGKNAVYKRE